MFEYAAAIREYGTRTIKHLIHFEMEGGSAFDPPTTKAKLRAIKWAKEVHCQKPVKASWDQVGFRLAYREIDLKHYLQLIQDPAEELC